MPDIRKIENLGPTPVPFSSRFAFHSAKVGATFCIDVAVPPPYLAAAGPLPVLLVTDGDLAFPTAAATASVLPIEPGGPKPVCVVGIGYGPGAEGTGAHFALRNRDLTPLRDAGWEARMRAAPPPFRFGEALRTGGGERFLDFILDELTPWLADTFPVDAADCTLAGNSFGASLTLHAMFARPGAFARYLAVSPSLWWANGYLADLEEAYAAAHADLDAQIYLCVGEAEEIQAPEARMVSALGAFADRLRARDYPSLRLRHEVLPGETHVSVFNAAISNGIRHLFGATHYI